MTLLLVLLGGAIGAPLRYLTDLGVQHLHDQVFPWGTWTVNVAGSFLLGLVGALVAHGTDPWLAAFVGTGVCGALTTFSTFGYETVRLVQEGARPAAVLNVAGSVVAGLAACTLGWELGGLG